MYIYIYNNPWVGCKTGVYSALRNGEKFIKVPILYSILLFVIVDDVIEIYCGNKGIVNLLKQLLLLFRRIYLNQVRWKDMIRMNYV